MSFLPTSVKEVRLLGWDCIDVIIVSGDAYIDHPSFGSAVIARTLENIGLRVAIIPQPNWQDDLRDFKKLGCPRLFFGVTSGCMDSMVNHYTANRRLRSDDAYTAGGLHGFRPDRAAVIYSKILKSIYPNTPVILGGIEASLRRATHYDYWENRLMPSILTDSGADLLVYGMGEIAITEIAEKIKTGKNIYDTKQIAYLGELPNNAEIQVLRSHEDCIKKSECFFENAKIMEKFALERGNKKCLVQSVNDKTLIINAPYPQMTEPEIDKSFDFPYTRLPHPRYEKRGEIPAYEMIKNSITTHRGCFGGCSFCAITAHQGKFIASRSENSIINEVKILTKIPSFKGNISDLGGPSANMYKMGGNNKLQCEKCNRPSCLFPKICDNLNTNHKIMNELYKKVAEINGVKKIFIGSGVRYDILLHAPNEEIKKENQIYTENLILHHTSGRLKLAPEHTENEVLKAMRKPPFEVYKNFLLLFQKICDKHNLKTKIVPYLISSHPNCTLQDMQNLTRTLRDLQIFPEQVQDFTPTPMTISTAFFYMSSRDKNFLPFTETDPKEKLKQKDAFFG
ncbi:UPF0313 protein [Fibrobacterales bacterium]|nr:UPF0313 protein [Fibrobacterales bacterium]